MRVFYLILLMLGVFPTIQAQNCVLTTSSSATAVCIDSPVVLTANTGSGIGNLQWQSSLNNSNWTNLQGITSATYRPSTSAESVIYYRVVANGGTCGTVIGNSVAVCVGSCTTGVCGNPLTQAKGFNLFVKNAASFASGDVEGAMAMGGDLTVNAQFQIALKTAGAHFAPGDSRRSSMVVGGRAILNNGGLNILGQSHVKIGNTAGLNIFPSNSGTRLTKGGWDANPKISLQVNQSESSIRAGNGVDFNGDFTILQQNSSKLAAKNNNVTLSSIGGGQFNLPLTSGRINVLNINGSTLNSVQVLNFPSAKPSSSTPLIINVNAAGTFNWNVPNFPGISDNLGAFVVFNFYNTTTLGIVNAAPIQGSILAPLAWINKTGTGNVNGQVVAASFTQANAGELHQYPLQLIDNSDCCPSLLTNITGNNAVCYGGSTTLYANVLNNSAPVSYQWQVWNGYNWNNIYGATGSTYTTPSLTSARYYRATARQSGCATYQSLFFLVNVYQDLSIRSHPNSFTSCVGTANQLSVGVFGGTSNVTYQWQVWTNNAFWSDVAGANSSTFTPPSNNSGTRYYRAVVRGANSGCDASYSNYAAVTHSTAPSVVASISNNATCSGGVINLSATIQGNGGTGQIQWQRSTDNATWTNISGATSTTYQAQNITSTNYFRVVLQASNFSCGTAVSNVMEVSAQTVFTVSAGNDRSICAGDTVTFFTRVTGGTAPYSYRWSNAGTSASTVVCPINDENYFVTVTDARGCTASDVVKYIALEKPTVSINGDDAVCSDASFSLHAIGSGGIAPYTVSWNTGENSNSITRQISNSQTFSVILTDARGCAAFDTTSVNTASSLAYQISTHNATVCKGDATTLTATLSANAPNCGVQWQTSPDGQSFWTNISGANSLTYTTSALQNSTYFRAVSTCPTTDCVTFSSLAGFVQVNQEPLVGIVGNELPVCRGGYGTLSAGITGGAGTPIYQWESSLNGVNFASIPGATQATFTTEPLSMTTHFRVLIGFLDASCSPAVSAVGTLVVSDDPSVLIVGQETVCAGSEAILSANSSGGTGNCSLQWQKQVGTLWLNVDGATNSDLAVTPSAPTTYRARLACTGSGCDVTYSDALTVSPVNTLQANSYANNNIICSGGQVELGIEATGSNGILSYQWQSSLNGIDFMNIPGANAPVFTTETLLQETWYRAVIHDSACGEIISSASLVEVLDDPVVGIVGTDIEVCVGGFALLGASVTGGAGTAAYQWQSSLDGINFSNILDGIEKNYTTDSLKESTYFRVVIQFSGNNCDPAVTASALIDVKADPQVTVREVEGRCTDCRVELVAETSGGSGTASLTWQRKVGALWINVPNQSNAILALMQGDLNEYRARYVATGGGCDVAFSDAQNRQPNSNLVVSSEELTFSAYKNGFETDLRWIARGRADEQIQYFTIERRGESPAFETILRVEALETETQTLKATDNAPLDGLNYYRVVTHLSSGRSIISSVSSVIFPKTEHLRIFPNPAKDFAYLDVQDLNGQKVEISIVNLYGVTVKTIESVATDKPIRLDLAGLGVGQYILSIRGEGRTRSRKLIVAPLD